MLRFPHLGNRTYGAEASDVVVKFKFSPLSGGFTREGDDLVYCENVTLLEAFTPKPVSIKTLDGRTLSVTPNELITPQTRLVVENEGMPHSPSGEVVVDTKEYIKTVSNRQKGNLIVRFNIKFPQKILTHHKETILGALATEV